MDEEIYRSRFGGFGEPCGAEGVRDCHAVVARHEGFVDCFNGRQACIDGKWSSCVGDPNGTVTTHALPGPGLDLSLNSLSPLSLSAASATGAPCSSDPCDPYCVGFNEVPPSPLSPTVTCGSGATVVGATQCEVSSTWWQDNAIGCSASNPNDCFFGDTCCAAQKSPAYPGTAACGYTAAGTNYCIARSVAGTACPAACAGSADYSAPPACDTADGHSHLSICNRGAANSPSTGHVVFSMFNPGDSRKECGSCGANGSANDHFTGVRGSCAVDLSVLPISAGSCIDVDLTKAIAGTMAGVTCSSPTISLAGSFGIYVNMYSSTLSTPGADSARMPTASVGTGWTAPNQALTNDGLYASSTVTAPTLPATAAASKTPTDPWSNVANAYAVDGAFATANPGKNKTSVLELTYAGVSVPAGASLTGLTVAVAAKISTLDPGNTTYKVELLDNTDTAVATFATAQAFATAVPGALPTWTLPSSAWAGRTLDFTKPLVRFTVTRGATASAYVVSLDAVTITPLYGYTQEWGTFNVSVPSNATVTSIDWTARLLTANSNASSSLVFGAYANGTLIAGTSKALTTSSSPALPAPGPTTLSWSSAGLSLAPSNFANGTFTVRAQPGGTANFTASLDYVSALVHYTTSSVVAAPDCSGTPGLTDCNSCNNWSAMDFVSGAHPACPSSGGGSAPPLNSSNTYQMSCPPGSKGVWNLLGYSAVTPAGTDVALAVQVSQTGASGSWVPTTGTPLGIKVADAPIDHPASCTMNGPSPCGAVAGVNYPSTCSCPVDLGAALGATYAQYPYLQLNAELTGTTSTCSSSTPFVATTVGGQNSGTECNGGQDTGISTCTTNADCQQDWHCSAGLCQWSGSGTYFDPTCAGVDLTIGVPCAAGASNTAPYNIPICNRGSGTLTASPASPRNILLQDDGNGGHPAWPNCDTTSPPSSGGASTCTYVLTQNLGPGQCVDVNTATTPACAVLESGHRHIFVNADRAIPECGTPVASGGSGGTGAGCNNNVTETKANAGANCPPQCTTPPPPGGSVPKLTSWQVTYSCIPAQ